MTTPLRRLAGSAAFIVLLTAILALATFLIGHHLALSRQDWPGWLQAIGSIWAILVAVWVSWQQAEAQRRRDEDAQIAEVKGVIRSLRAEAETTLEYANTHIADDLRESKPGTPFNVVFPLPESPFPIFDALIPKLGLISNDELQRQIIHTFTLGKSLALTIKHHNLMVNELQAAELRRKEQPYAISDGGVQPRWLELAAYSDNLRDEFDPAMQQLNTLLQALRDACPGD